LNEFGDALGSLDYANLDAIIERVLLYTLEAMLNQDWTSTWRQSMDGVPGAETPFVSWLTCKCGIVPMSLYIVSSHGELADGG